MAKYQITLNKYKPTHLAKIIITHIPRMTKSLYMPYIQNV
ncbi:hypothetical protein F383_27913 [Gossypium arboreum]|uniref:Uncharacterized protein n=1 Tax=Gossypium arboreum TaxID=29729 RepID=A0A0B0MXD5_GOSAR|nr:hypothetical protein F383_27913 [Gossypium arboreum]